MMKQHPRLFATLFIVLTIAFYVVGVAFAIKTDFMVAIILWIVGMIFLINGVYCIQDYKKKKMDDRYN